MYRYLCDSAPAISNWALCFQGSTMISGHQYHIGITLTGDESMSSSGPDAVLLELFAAEADMHLPVLSEGLLALEKGVAGKKEIDSMMRAAHSIKGAARIVGNDPAVRIAHALEDCFTAAKEGRIALQSDSVDVLLLGVDALQRTCSPGQDPELTEERMQTLLGRIGAVQEGKRPSAENASSSVVSLASAPTSAPPRQE